MRTVDPERAAKRRRQILDAAVVCFQKKGFHGASMSSICSEAKMSPGHLYHYFRSKEDLVEAIVEEDSVDSEAMMRELLLSSNILEALLQRVETIWTKELRISRTLRTEILAEACRNRRISEIFRKHDGRIRRTLSEILMSAQEKNQVNKSIDPEGFATFIIGMISGLTSSYEAGCAIDIDRTTQAIRTMLAQMLTP